MLTLAGPLVEKLAALAHSFEHGRLVHSGLTLAIVGQPNVGKSSLFNRLVERERAIVTATPGTTRDLVTERVSLAGIPVELIDTAGLRVAKDEAERLGIEKSREALADADLVLLVLDASQISLSSLQTPVIATDIQQLLGSLEGRPAIVVLNKCDLLEPGAQPAAAIQLDYDLQELQALLAKALPGSPTIPTSAYTGEGIAALRHAIRQQLQTPALSSEGGMLTNLRQHQSVESALAALQAALAATPAQTPHEMLLIDLYATLLHLDTLTGETTPDDILNLIFSTFCIGK